MIPELAEKNLPRHQYSGFQIYFWITLLNKAATKMRCASNIMNLTFTLFDLPMVAPSWYSGRLWLMKLAYYKLNRVKEKASDWIYILDHSVQIGPEKCLIILGVRAKNLPKSRPLVYSDLEPIDLVPVKKSNGDIVYKQLESASEKTGIPAATVSDYGSDLKSGIDKFIDKHRETRSFYDIKHKTASVLKQALENDPQWIDFTKHCCMTKAQVQQTELAFLAPPNQRSKSRYMNVEILITWGIKMTVFLNQEKDCFSKEYEQAKIKEKLDWILAFQNDIKIWENMIKIVGVTESFVRNKGLTYDMHKDLEVELNKLNIGDRENSIKEKLLDFIKQQSQKIKPGERFLGSSEIIESLFGKQKNLEGAQSKNGFTGLILGAAAFVSETTIDVVAEAMGSVKIKDIKGWISKNIGTTVQSARKKVLNKANIKEVKSDQLLT